MQAVRLIALRHGETAWNADGRIQGQLDIGLNDTGLWQAQRLARALADEPLHAVHTSDLLRAHQTAQPLALGAGLPVQGNAGLRERHLGDFQGRTVPEIEALWPDQYRAWRERRPDFAPSGGGESLLQFRDRIMATVNTLARAQGQGQIAVVAHGGVMDLLYRAATGQELQTPRTWTLANAAINRLLWTPGSLTLVGWADTQHLNRTALDDESLS
ncbi:MAG: histidine phosphatase family protein [Pseudomonadota bacterium]